MSRLSFIADIHVGNHSTFGGPVHAGINQRGREVLATLEGAVEQAQNANSDALVICGDLFDTANPSPQLIAEVQRILLNAPKTLVLMGNHDMVSDASGDNALGPLSFLPNVLPVETPEVYTFEDTALLMVPFQTGDAREWFPEVVGHLAAVPVPEGTKKVLAFHLGVIDSETPAFLAKAHDAIEAREVHGLMLEYGIDYAFCGNWHSPKKWTAKWGDQLVQCGALCPTGWDNPGWDYGRVWTVNTDTELVTFREVPGPRFLSVEEMEDAEGCVEKANQYGHSLYLSLKGEIASDPAMLETVREWGVKARAVADGEAAREATKAAAVAVRGASTLNDALARYVAAMPVGEGVDREQVKAMARKYLGSV